MTNLRFVFYVFLLISFCSQLSCFENIEKFDVISEFFNGGLLRGLGKYVENSKDYRQCYQDIRIWARDFLTGKLWAFKMIDSDGRIPSGLMMLNTYSLGQFDQCISIHHQNENENVKGKYCVAKIPVEHFIPLSTVREHERMFHLRKNSIQSEAINSRMFGMDSYGRIVLDLGICIPDSCNTNEIRELINEILESKDVNMTKPLITVPENLCTTSKSTEWTPADWGALVFFIIFGMLVLISTISDIFMNQKNNDSDKGKSSHLSFSIWTNTRNLIKISRSPKNIKCLHGIRVLSLLWIIMGHRFSYELFMPLVNLSESLKFIERVEGWFLISGVYAVDSFFVLSGLLVAFISFNQLKKEECFNFPLMYLHRYLRLTPALAAVVFFQATLFRYIGNGPLWVNNADIDAKNCQKYWWSALLYVQNYVNPNEMCIAQTWYISCDMQFFILSPIVIYPLLKWKRLGVANLVFWILISQIVTFIIAYENEWTGAIFAITGLENKMERFDVATHAKGAPWLLGFAAGYMLHLCSKSKVRLNKIFVVVGWILSLALMAAVVFGWKSFGKLDREITHLEDTTFNAFSKTSWSLALVWIIMACALGYGGPVNWFLSWDIWEILGKFTYSMYLVHMMLQYWQLSEIRQPIYILDFYGVISFFGDTVLSFFIGYLLMISFELPFMMLDKKIFDKKKPKKIERKISSVEVKVDS